MSCSIPRTPRRQAQLRGTLLQWPLFPADIRWLVFEELARDSSRCEDSTTPGKRGLARYAGVCKEWQAFFEKILYRRLVLKQSCLDAFDKIVRPRRDLVKHIWLRIELGEHRCLYCMEYIHSRRRRADSDIVGGAIMQLFRILSVWPNADVASHGGLLLELGFYSPSDSQDAFSGHPHFGPGPFETEDGEHRRICSHDPDRRRVHGEPSVRRSMPSISRIFGVIAPEFREELPTVKVVTRFILRRQTRRNLDPMYLQKIFKRLPSLECINFEPWGDFLRFPKYPRCQRTFNTSSRSLLA